METFNRLSRKEKYVWDVSNLDQAVEQDLRSRVEHPDLWPCMLFTFEHHLVSHTATSLGMVQRFLWWKQTNHRLGSKSVGKSLKKCTWLPSMLSRVILLVRISRLYHAWLDAKHPSRSYRKWSGRSGEVRCR